MRTATALEVIGVYTVARIDQYGQWNVKYSEEGYRVIHIVKYPLYEIGMVESSIKNIGVFPTLSAALRNITLGIARIEKEISNG